MRSQTLDSPEVLRLLAQLQEQYIIAELLTRGKYAKIKEILGHRFSFQEGCQAVQRLRRELRELGYAVHVASDWVTLWLEPITLEVKS